jgi:hypothetical protein
VDSNGQCHPQLDQQLYLADLHQVVQEHGCTTHQLWLAIENQFLSNREQRTLHLDATFRNFVQGDLSVVEYCLKFKTMADGLTDLGSPVEDRILVHNILQGLNQCFKYMGSIIRRYLPFLNFLKVRDDLLLEEIHMDSTDLLAAPMTLYTNAASQQPGHHPPCYLTHPAVATMAIKTRTTTRTAMTVMTVATTTGIPTVVAIVIALLARPPSPVPLTIEPACHG